MKVLCLRLSAIGDVVVTTPVLRALHRQLGAEVHVLTKAAPGLMLVGNPHVRRVWTYPLSLGDWARLRAERFDLVVDLHCNARTHALRLRLGRPAVGYRKRNSAKAALVRRGVDRLGREHLAERYFRALAPLGVVYDGEGLDYFVQPGERASALLALPRALRGGDFVAVALGATHATKRMPAELVTRVLRALGGRAVLLGGDDVVDLAREVADALRREADFALGGGEVVDLVGGLELRVSCAVVAEARAVLSPDTGLMHVAAALGKPQVSVWGSTVPAFGMYPLRAAGAGGEAVEAGVGGLACRPCSRIGYAACPRGHFRCMRDQDAAAIAGALAGGG